MRGSPHSYSRPWWILDSYVGYGMTAAERWEDTVRLRSICAFSRMLIGYEQVNFWNDLFSKNQYDGVIGLSQGGAMAGLLVSMVSSSFFLCWDLATWSIVVNGDIHTAEPPRESAGLPSSEDSTHQICHNVLWWVFTPHQNKTAIIDSTYHSACM